MQAPCALLKLQRRRTCKSDYVRGRVERIYKWLWATSEAYGRVDLSAAACFPSASLVTEINTGSTTLWGPRSPCQYLAGTRVFERHRNCFPAHASPFGDVLQQLKVVPYRVRSAP